MQRLTQGLTAHVEYLAYGDGVDEQALLRRQLSEESYCWSWYAQAKR